MQGYSPPSFLDCSRSLLAGYTPPNPLAINQVSPYGQFNSVGTGYLAGKLTGSDPITPATIRIHARLVDGQPGDGDLVATVQVDLVGNWRVDNLNTSLRYDVVARREGYNDVITAGVQPLPM